MNELSNAIENAIEEVAMADRALLTEHTTCFYQSENTEDKGWKHEQTWSYINGESVTLDARFDGEILIPATAGYELVWFEGWKCDDPSAHDISKDVTRVPVIGWEFNEDLALPITVAGHDVPGGTWSFKGMLYPDGRVAWHAPKHFRLRCGEPPPVYASLKELIGVVHEVWSEVIGLEEKELRQAEAAKPRPHCGRH